MSLLMFDNIGSCGFAARCAESLWLSDAVLIWLSGYAPSRCWGSASMRR